MTHAAKVPTSEAIPFLDLVGLHRPLQEEFVAALRRVLDSAGFVGGPEVTAFEDEFARFCDAPAAVGLSNGTDALRFAYMAMGVSPGDEIITVPNTFIATTEAITQAGGTIKFVDVRPDTLTMDPAALEAAISERTVGVVPVHLYGQPADLDPIATIAKAHRLWVVEDAAQAHGAEYRGRPVGSIGDLAGFSFYPGKNLGACGEGGAVTGRDLERLATIRRLREHGQSQKYYHDTEGYNGRLDSLQAAFLRIKLRLLGGWNDGRRRAAQLYRAALKDIAEIDLPTEAPYSKHVYHLFVIQADRRDQLQAHLAKRKIGTGLHYPLPLHLQKAYESFGLKKGTFPITEASAESILSLPMYPDLEEASVDRVASAIREFYRG